MQKIKNMLLVLLVAVMVVSTFTACAKKESTDGGTVDNAQSDEGSSDSSNKKAEDKEIITIKWFVDQEWYQKKWDEENCAIDKMITDATGIKIEFLTGKPEKLSALIASGELPDVITAGNNSPQTLLLQDENMVLPLNELITKYAPEFNVPESMQKWHGKDGDFYGIVNFFYAPEKLKEGENLPTHTVMLARNDLMEQLGIKPEDFNTKEGTIEALKKVRNNNITFNGFKVQPAFYEYGKILQMFGARREDENGNYVDRNHEPEALEAYKFMNELYREKLLSEEFLTLNDQQTRQKVGQGSVFSINSSLMQNDQVAPLYALDKEAYFVEIGPVKSERGKQPHFDPSAMAGWLTTMINKDTKQADRIIKLFEYLYSEDEMHLNAKYGPRGITWDYDENGRVQLFEEVKKEMDADVAKSKLKYGQDTIITFYDWIPIMRTLPAPNNVAEEATEQWIEYFESFSYPDLAFSKGTPDPGTDLAAIKVRIDEYVKKMEPKIIMAKSEAEVEKLFNEMIAHKKELGYDELFEYQSEMFKQSKEKLDLEFAWPANQK